MPPVAGFTTCPKGVALRKDHLGSTRTVVKTHDYAKDIPSGLPIWVTHARAHLPERQRDKGEVYGERTG